MLTQAIANLSSGQVFWLSCAAIFAVYLTISSVIGSLAREWRKARVAALEADLKREMLARGMPIEDIERLASTSRRDRKRKPQADGAPGPGEVVVLGDGDWKPGIVVQAKDDSCLIHVVGRPMSECRWMGLSEVRFPASAVGHPVVGGDDGPTAIEAVARNPWDDEWSAALVTRTGENRYYVHFIEDEDSSYDGWVDEAEIRFALNPGIPTAAVFAGDARNGRRPMKPAFAEPEL